MFFANQRRQATTRARPIGSYGKPMCVMVVVGVFAVTGCSRWAVDDSGLTGPMVPVPSGTRTISETLKSDPRFSDFVHEIDFSGLGHSLNAAKGVTVFAPTNDAFRTSDPDWQARTLPNETSNAGGGAASRQALMKQSGLAGIHPPADFMGKLQDVRSIGGRVFHVDGRASGTITITTEPAHDTGINFITPSVNVAHVIMPPIVASDGLIYPVDAIIIR